MSQQAYKQCQGHLQKGPKDSIGCCHLRKLKQVGQQCAHPSAHVEDTRWAASDVVTCAVCVLKFASQHFTVARVEMKDMHEKRSGGNGELLGVHPQNGSLLGV